MLNDFSTYKSSRWFGLTLSAYSPKRIFYTQIFKKKIFPYYTPRARRAPWLKTEEGGRATPIRLDIMNDKSYWANTDEIDGVVYSIGIYSDKDVNIYPGESGNFRLGFIDKDIGIKLQPEDHFHICEGKKIIARAKIIPALWKDR